MTTRSKGESVNLRSTLKKAFSGGVADGSVSFQKPQRAANQPKLGLDPKYSVGVAKELILESFMTPKSREMYKKSVQISAATFSENELLTLWTKQVEIQLARDQARAFFPRAAPVEDGKEGERIIQFVKNARKELKASRLVKERQELLEAKKRTLEAKRRDFQLVAASLNGGRSPAKAQSRVSQPGFNLAAETSNMAKLLSNRESELFSNPDKKERLPEEIKGKKSNLELKISGEQNRVLLGNIRPSFYREKNDAPTLAQYDDQVKLTSTFLKPVSKQSIMSSKTFSATFDATKEDPIVVKFKTAVGSEAFSRVRDLFEQYSALSGRLHYMDGYEFHRFMKENGFYTETTTKLTLDLLFSKNNKAKEICFSRFIEIMYEIAKLQFPGLSEDMAMDSLLKAHIFTRQSINYQEKSSRFEDWFIELENPSVVDYLNSQKSFFLARFKKYQINHQEFGVCITQQDVIKFCQQSGIVPNLLTLADCNNMFKASQRKNSKTLHSEYLLFSEFTECICFIAFLYYSKPENQADSSGSYLGQIQNLLKWLVKRGYQSKQLT